jgi:PAS domain S-box-containing protein
MNEESRIKPIPKPISEGDEPENGTRFTEGLITEELHLNASDPSAARLGATAPPFLIRRNLKALLGLNIRVQEAGSVHEKLTLLTEEIGELFCQTAVWAAVFDENFTTLNAAIYTNDAESLKAVEAYLQSPAESKQAFFNYICSRRHDVSRGAYLFTASDLQHQLESESIDVPVPAIVPGVALDELLAESINDEIPLRENKVPEYRSPHDKLYGVYCLSRAAGLRGDEQSSDTPFAERHNDILAFFPVRAESTGVSMLVMLGGSLETAPETNTELENLHDAVEMLIRAAADSIETHHLAQKNSKDNAQLRATTDLTLKLIDNATLASQRNDLPEKLEHFCKGIIEQNLADVAAIVVLSENLDVQAANFYAQKLIEDTATQKNNLLQGHDKQIQAEFFTQVFSKRRQVSKSYVIPDAVMKTMEAQHSLRFFKLIAEKTDSVRGDSSVTALMPLYTEKQRFVGFIACWHSSAVKVRTASLRAIETFARLVEKNIELTLYKDAPTRQYKRRKESRNDAGVITSLQEFNRFTQELRRRSSAVEKSALTLELIVDKANVVYAAAALFNESDEPELASMIHHGEAARIPKPPSRYFNASRPMLSRSIAEAVFSATGLETQGCYAVSQEELELLRNAVESGLPVPVELQVADAGKMNFSEFALRNDIMLLTPLRYAESLLGYVMLGEWKKEDPETESNQKKYDDGKSETLRRDRLEQASLFAKALAGSLYEENMRRAKEELATALQISRNLTASLDETVQRLPMVKSPAERVLFLAHALSQQFGFEFASVVLHDDDGKIMDAGYAIHSESTVQHLEGRFSERLKRGMNVASATLNYIFSKAFQTRFGFFYSISDLRETISKLRRGERAENYAAQYLQSYIDGGETVRLMLPIMGDAGKRIGYVELGQMLLRNLNRNRVAFEERLKIVGALIGQLGLLLKSEKANEQKDSLNDSLIRSESRFRNLVENVNYGFVLCGAEKKMEYVNSAFRGIMGFSADKLVGNELENFITMSSQEALQKMMRGVYEKKVRYDGELSLISITGEEIPFSVISVPQLLVGKKGDLFIEGAFCIFADLRAERDLKRKQQELQTIKDNFYAMIVHDMKVPLSAIYGYSEIMRQMTPATIEEDYFRQMMTRIYDSAKNINGLVLEIMEFSKYESKAVQLDKRTNDFALCVEVVLEQNQFTLLEKNISIRREYNMNVDWKFTFDFDRVSRVLANLVSNAIKFSRADADIVVRIQRAQQKNIIYAVFSIQDFGEGIPKETIDLIFDAYKQAQSKHGSRGTGLGLSIAKQIIELHGGKIWAESEYGKWTRVSFTLPLVKADEPKA